MAKKPGKLESRKKGDLPQVDLINFRVANKTKGLYRKSRKNDVEANICCVSFSVKAKILNKKRYTTIFP